MLLKKGKRATNTAAILKCSSAITDGQSRSLILILNIKKKNGDLVLKADVGMTNAVWTWWFCMCADITP